MRVATRESERVRRRRKSRLRGNTGKARVVINMTHQSVGTLSAFCCVTYRTLLRQWLLLSYPPVALDNRDRAPATRGNALASRLYRRLHPGHLHHLPAPAAGHERRARRRLQLQRACGARDDGRQMGLRRRSRRRVPGIWLRARRARHANHLMAPAADREARPRGLLEQRRAERTLHHLAPATHRRGRRHGRTDVIVLSVYHRRDGLPAAPARHRGHARRDQQLASALRTHRHESLAVPGVGVRRGAPGLPRVIVGAAGRGCA